VPRHVPMHSPFFDDPMWLIEAKYVQIFLMQFCVCTGKTVTTFRVLDGEGNAIGEVVHLTA
jgi:hypothetical protein